MSCDAQDLVVPAGKSYTLQLRWEVAPQIFKLISAVPQKSPLRLTVTSHNVPDQWRVAINNVKGMYEINAKYTPPRESDYYVATVVDADTLEFNNIDAGEFHAYTSGGTVQYNTPVDLSPYTAVFKVEDVVGGTALADLSIYVVLDNAAKTITVSIPATITSGWTFTQGVYELALTDGVNVISMISGDFIVQDTVVD